MIDKTLFKVYRNWFHVSDYFVRDTVTIKPKKSGKNRSDLELEIPRICVAPSIEQCMVALPLSFGNRYCAYVTEYKILACPPYDPFDTIFDSSVTQEGWILSPVSFIKLGEIDLTVLVNNSSNPSYVKSNIFNVACGNDAKQSKVAYNWWKAIKLVNHMIYSSESMRQRALPYFKGTESTGVQNSVDNATDA